MSTPEATPQLDESVAERFQLKAIVEACLVLEEGIAGVREIDLGLMMGTGMVPGPFARADLRGLTQPGWQRRERPMLLHRRELIGRRIEQREQADACGEHVRVLGRADARQQLAARVECLVVVVQPFIPRGHDSLARAHAVRLGHDLDRRAR